MSDKASLIQQPAPLADVGLQREIATLLVRALNLEVEPQDIDPEAALYGEGLGLDSIDILEVALIVSKQYGIHLRADGKPANISFPEALSRVHCGAQDQVVHWRRRVQVAAIVVFIVVYAGLSHYANSAAKTRDLAVALALGWVLGFALLLIRRWNRPLTALLAAIAAALLLRRYWPLLE